LTLAPNGREVVVRIHNTNTQKIIVSRFPVEDGRASVDGDLELDGVAGSGAPIWLEFQDPGGARTGRLLPTGNAVDTLDLPGAGPVAISMVDCANPCVFVAAAALGLAGTELPDALEREPAILARLERVRCHASVAMGLASSLEAAGTILGAPKVAMVAGPADAPTLSGRTLGAADVDILVRMISIGQPHRAVPLTGALCLAAACRVPGSVPFGMVSPAARTLQAQSGPLRIGHPSGVVLVDAETEVAAGATLVRHATVYRTARRLFTGEVYYRIPKQAAE